MYFPQFQNLLITLCGSLFYFALGANRIAHIYEPWDSLTSEMEENLLHTSTKLALGSLAIINGFVYLGDLVLGLLDCKKDEWSKGSCQIVLILLWNWRKKCDIIKWCESLQRINSYTQLLFSRPLGFNTMSFCWNWHKKTTEKIKLLTHSSMCICTELKEKKTLTKKIKRYIASQQQLTI